MKIEPNEKNRKSEKFKVKFSKKKRYRKSAIPYMVNLLNINNKKKEKIYKQLNVK